MKKLLLSTLIFFGLFGVSINSVNAEALTDTERLQILQKHAGDIAFVDDTTLADVVWLTIGLDEEGLKWFVNQLKKQASPSHTDVLEALVDTSPDSITFVNGTTLEDVAWFTDGLDSSETEWVAKYLKQKDTVTNKDISKALEALEALKILTDNDRLELLQQSVNDINFIDGTTLNDIAWLTIGLKKPELQKVAGHLKQQAAPSNLDVLEAITKYPPKTLPALAHINTVFTQHLEKLQRCKYFWLRDNTTIEDMAWITIRLTDKQLEFFLKQLHMKNSYQNRVFLADIIKARDEAVNHDDVTNEVANKQPAKKPIVIAALLLTAIVAKNVLGRG